MGSKVFTIAYRRTFLVRLMVALLLTVCCLVGGLYLYLNRPFYGDYLVAMTELERLRQAVRWSVTATVFLQLGVFSLLIWLSTLFWTHKIAGPLYRLRQVFTRLAAGDWRPMARVRCDDQLQEIPAVLNRGLEVLQLTAREKQAQLARLQAEIEQLTAEFPVVDKIEVVEHLARLRRQLHQIIADRFWSING